MPVICCNLRKTSKMLILGPKVPYLPYFGHNKNFLENPEHFYPPFNACHQVHFQKKYKEQFLRKVQMLIFGPKKPHLQHFGHIFAQKRTQSP